MSEVNYLTAHNLYDVQNLPPHPKLSDDDLRLALKEMIALRSALETTLEYAILGAEDLRTGDYWSENIELFESLSMEQARSLAKYRIRINHRKYGRIVFKARADFVAFRESVRHEVIGKVFTDTTAADFDASIDQITREADATMDSMWRIAQALEADGY